MIPLVFVSTFVAASPQLNLEQRIDRMLHATHGVSPASGYAVPIEAQAICQDAKTVPLVSAQLDPAAHDQKVDPDRRRRADNAIGLLAYFCGQAGRAEVKTRIEALRLTRDMRRVELLATIRLALQDKRFQPRAAELHQRVGEMAGIERTALRTLAAVKDASLVSSSLQRLLSDPYLQYELARYLAAVTSKDPAVTAAFEDLHGKTTDPAVLRLLDAYAK